MGIGRWIGGFLGFINGGPLGALAGYAIGWLFDKGAEGFSNNADNTFDNGTYRNSNTYGGYSAQQQYEGQRNSFLFSLLVLASYIMKADGRVMHSEMELVRNFLRRNFGEIAVREGEEILLRLFERQKQMGEAAFKNTIRESCAEIAQHMDYSQRLQLLNFLVLIAQADGTVPQSEIDALHFVAASLGISAEDLSSMLNLSSGGTSLEGCLPPHGTQASPRPRGYARRRRAQGCREEVPEDKRRKGDHIQSKRAVICITTPSCFFECFLLKNLDSQ